MSRTEDSLVQKPYASLRTLILIGAIGLVLGLLMATVHVLVLWTGISLGLPLLDYMFANLDLGS